ncbi:MAG: hypothetical protein M3Z20_19345 [Chloroflexota bacterium]|nr:hypothetical protein [Chloroflexota bacterium]
MSRNASIEPLLGHHLWRASQASQLRSSESTRHAPLDAALPGGGRPDHALMEVLLTADGTGELALLLLTITRLTAARRDVALVGAAYIP